MVNPKLVKKSLDFLIVANIRGQPPVARLDERIPSSVHPPLCVSLPCVPESNSQVNELVLFPTGSPHQGEERQSSSPGCCLPPKDRIPIAARRFPASRFSISKIREQNACDRCTESSRLSRRDKTSLHPLRPRPGSLDWASQPYPFRSYLEAPEVPLEHFPDTPDISYDELYLDQPSRIAPLDARTIAEFCRYSLGLSAWKQFGTSRWSLRVNPSSGNLHPTEGYLVLGRCRMA